MTASPVDTLDPLLITVAPNGARRTYADHPALPITPSELARTAVACRAAGAAMIHLHVRDREAKHTLDVDTYRAAIAAIRKAVGDELVIQVTSEAVSIYRPEQQMAMIRDLQPEAVSIGVREIIPDAVHETAAADFLHWLSGTPIMPQFILYSAEELRWFNGLLERGVVPYRAPPVLFVLGRYTQGQRSSPQDLLPYLEANERGLPWSVCAFGRLEAACVICAQTLGGHTRVGFENNLYLASGEVAPDNAALVNSAARGAELIGRPLADAAQTRALFRQWLS